MPVDYALEWDDGHRLFRYRMAGLWDEPTLRKWEELVAKAMAEAPASPWQALGDLSEFPAQHDTVNDGRRRLLDLLIEHGCERGAMVVPRAVIQMQSKRIAGGTADPDRFRYFATHDEAMAWLQS